jgi:hypothetical protein
MRKIQEHAKLTDAPGLLKLVWAEDARPSLRWLREQQKRNVIPHIKVAGRVFFDPDHVREALAVREERNLMDEPARR